MIDIFIDVDSSNPETDLNAESYIGGTTNYELLHNKPKLNGREIIGDIPELDPTVPDWAKESKKPTYNPEEIGALGEDDAMLLSDIDDMFEAIFGGN